MEERHKKEMAIVRDEHKKMKDEYAVKMDVEKQLVKVQKSEKSIMAKVKDLGEEMRDILISSHPVPSFIEFTMAQYSSYKRHDDNWISPPFYSGLRGYKMCLEVYANGCDRGAGTHVSVFVCLMGGKYDGELKWPFQGKITIHLINCKYDRFCEMTVHFDRAAMLAGVSDKVKSGRIARDGWGSTRFMSHYDIHPYTETINDCLTFRVVKIVVY